MSSRLGVRCSVHAVAERAQHRGHVGGQLAREERLVGQPPHVDPLPARARRRHERPRLREVVADRGSTGDGRAARAAAPGSAASPTPGPYMRATLPRSIAKLSARRTRTSSNGGACVLSGMKSNIERAVLVHLRGVLEPQRRDARRREQRRTASRPRRARPPARRRRSRRRTRSVDDVGVAGRLRGVRPLAEARVADEADAAVRLVARDPVGPGARHRRRAGVAVRHAGRDRRRVAEDGQLEQEVGVRRRAAGTSRVPARSSVRSRGESQRCARTVGAAIPRNSRRRPSGPGTAARSRGGSRSRAAGARRSRRIPRRSRNVYSRPPRRGRGQRDGEVRDEPQAGRAGADLEGDERVVREAAELQRLDRVLQPGVDRRQRLRRHHPQRPAAVRRRARPGRRPTRARPPPPPPPAARRRGPCA